MVLSLQRFYGYSENFTDSLTLSEISIRYAAIMDIKENLGEFSRGIY